MTRHQLRQLPLPVAYPAGRLSAATDPADRVAKAQRLAEMVAVTLGVMALGWCQARLFDPRGMRDRHHKVAKNGNDLDAWINALRATTKIMRDRPEDPVASAVRLASRAAYPELTRCRLLRRMSIGDRRIPLLSGQVSVPVAVSPAELDATADAIMDAVEPLAHVRLGLVRQITRSGHAYLASLDVLAGPAAPFPRHSLLCHSPYDAGSVIVYHEGNPEFAVDLTPYCIWRRCPACGGEELFYLHRQDQGADRYVSFSTGHETVVTAGRLTPSHGR